MAPGTYLYCSVFNHKLSTSIDAVLSVDPPPVLVRHDQRRIDTATYVITSVLTSMYCPSADLIDTQHLHTHLQQGSSSQHISLTEV